VQATATIEELRRQLRNFEKERDNALNESKLLLSAKDDLQLKLDALQDKYNSDREHIASLEGAARQRDSALSALEKEMTDARDRLQTNQIEMAQLEQNLENLTSNYDDSTAQIDGLNKKLAAATNNGDKLLAERNKLTGALELIEDRAGDVNDALTAEQDAHAQTQEELITRSLP